jgi:hypothetical protein
MEQIKQIDKGEKTLSRAWYEAAIGDFCLASEDSIIGVLAKNSGFAIEVTQSEAWVTEIRLLKKSLKNLDGQILMEFSIPRVGKRVDAILLINNTIFVLEFKTGERKFLSTDSDQAWDYALDLKNFHKDSHNARIVPVLIATEAPQSMPVRRDCAEDGVYPPQHVNSDGLCSIINVMSNQHSGNDIDVSRWARASYQPTPTIIEAARVLFQKHSVMEITRNEAGENITVTSKYIEKIVQEAQLKQKKYICFVTGVPGAGKTLVGLNLSTQRRDEKEKTHAVFLSGNGPLVSVLREALTRDVVAQEKLNGKKLSKVVAGKPVEKFIQNVHHFRDDALKDNAPPSEHVVIFDEAQRAWDLRKTADFMKRKKKQPDFNQSEPTFLISYMDRHHDWAVIVCLVGGGQEIHDGEAGIGAWIEAIMQHFPHWTMFLSPNLRDTEYAAGNAVQEAKKRADTQLEDHLHLAVSMRSFRSEKVSSFIKSLLDLNDNLAKKLLKDLCGKYPIAVTRNLTSAKQWIKKHARASERFGLLASSKASRLKPDAIDIRVKTDTIYYFLGEKNDPRSCFYLEDAATEFQVQGLELDWACIAWDCDFRIMKDEWTYHSFRGAKWNLVKKPEHQMYLKNAYRVLLTRARQGFIIYIPQGDPADHTRLPEYYNGVYEYLICLGIPQCSVCS